MAHSPIVGKIAAVISDTVVVINRGSQHGVVVGMLFDVFLSVVPIVDPDDPTNVLEGFRYRKGTLQVDQVSDRMSFCSIQGRTVFRDPYVTGLNLPQPTTVRPGVFAPLLQSQDWLIKKGDVVEQLLQERQATPKTG